MGNRNERKNIFKKTSSTQQVINYYFGYIPHVIKTISLLYKELENIVITMKDRKILEELDSVGRWAVTANKIVSVQKDRPTQVEWVKEIHNYL